VRASQPSPRIRVHEKRRRAILAAIRALRQGGHPFSGVPLLRAKPAMGPLCRVHRRRVNGTTPQSY
jgi:hypothetical protein